MDLHPDPVQEFVPADQNSPQHHFHVQYSIPSVRQKIPSSPVSNGFSSSPTTNDDQPLLPQVGQTRCYWALLTTSLQFTVLDPVLRYHLQEQAACILNHELLDFVHPDERESARRDLGNVLAERALHGSVTRVRYCRLSRVRRLLGWSDTSLPYPRNFPAELIAVDADYMAVYLVVNCVADGVVLCFIHAVVDIAPQADNDESRRTGWSNWCSTYGFDQEQAHALYHRLCQIAQPMPGSVQDSSLRVLQILQNHINRSLVVSWPPDSAVMVNGHAVSVRNTLAQLAQNVQLGYSGASNDARTSCTRRYKSVQTIKLDMVTGSKIVQVESILIPHGTIIFACHKISDPYIEVLHGYPYYIPNQGAQISSVDCHETIGSGSQGCDSSMFTAAHQNPSSQNYVQHWVDQQLQVQVRQEDSKLRDSADASSPVALSTPVEAGRKVLDVGAFSQHQWQKASRIPDKDISTGVDTSIQRCSAMEGRSLGTLPPSIPSSSSHTYQVAGRGSHSSSRDVEAPAGAGKSRLVKERIGSYGKGQGNPPLGVTSCAHCQITHSPEWRKGPSGKKDLCNACGLRFSRSRAKTEGVPSRRRKNKDGESHPLCKQSRPLSNTGQSRLVSEIESAGNWPGGSMGSGTVSTPGFSQTSDIAQMSYLS